MEKKDIRKNKVDRILQNDIELHQKQTYGKEKK